MTTKPTHYVNSRKNTRTPIKPEGGRAAVAEVFRYCPTGRLLARMCRRGIGYWGVASTQRKDGYRVVYFQGRKFLEHRLVFLLLTGEWPKTIDHINGDPSDNRLENLRAVTNSGNMHNQQRLRADNKSGNAGVRWVGRRNKWEASTTINGSYKYLGMYQHKEDAVFAYEEAKDGIRLRGALKNDY